jgi:tetratricopeptide (TPR) repeat protein
MTSKHPSDGQWPLPLVAKKGEIADTVRAYAQDTGEPGGEAANFAGVMARMERRPRRVPTIAFGIALGALATATGLFVVAGHLRSDPSTTKVVASRPSTPPGASLSRPAETVAAAAQQPRAQVIPALPSLRLSDQPAALPEGESEIVVTMVRAGETPAAPPAMGQARVLLSADGVASGRSRDGSTEIALQRGSIELHVVPQAPGQGFVVVAGHHRFTVVGTVFSVSRIQTRIELRVQEGAVAVSRGARQLAVVRAGARWAAEEAQTPSAVAPAASADESPLAPSRPAAAVPAPSAEVARQPTATEPPAQAAATQAAPAPTPAAVVPAQADCRQLVATRHSQEAVGCYQQQATRNGLAGETAAYELARLWRDNLGQPDRAIAAFEAQRSRFPAGALRREADLSIIELLPRLGRHAEALVETQRFLSAYPRDDRKGEIYLLRGNIYREVFRDLAHAELEYSAGAGAKGRAGDDSRFFHAVCLEALGKPEDARAAYQAYLRQHPGAHGAEARNRLSKLAP